MYDFFGSESLTMYRYARTAKKHVLRKLRRPEWWLGLTPKEQRLMLLIRTTISQTLWKKKSGLRCICKTRFTRDLCVILPSGKKRSGCRTYTTQAERFPEPVSVSHMSFCFTSLLAVLGVDFKSLTSLI